MTLYEYLHDHMGEIVKVGANYGTNFLYCGKIDSSTIKWFRAMNEAYFQKYMIQKRGFTERGAMMREKMPRWIGILNREVVETFIASDVVEPEETTVVMVFGFEQGSFWTVEEFEKKVTEYREDDEDEEP